MSKSPTVIVGLSGGVDSSVSAALLKEQGYDVRGLFMKNWDEDSPHCPYEQDYQDVKQVCKTLKIPFDTVNFSEEYWQHVFRLFLDEYQAGRTPNPDILCNKEIKFKAFLEHALKQGADFIAMGHYVQNVETKHHAQLMKGADLEKDQSYFLYTLKAAQLQKSLFPIGHLSKQNVRKIAHDYGLANASKKDSTGICFIGERNFKSFIQEYLPTKPGIIQTPEGKIVGQHDGLMYYTLGQRQGLKIGGIQGTQALPWFVVGKSLEKNRLYVTQDIHHPWHHTTSLKGIQIEWVNPIESKIIECYCKVRYRQQDVPCTINIMDTHNIIVTFKTPQKAVTPGQSVVFYQNDICLGGAIIESTDSPGGLSCSISH